MPHKVDKVYDIWQIVQEQGFELRSSGVGSYTDGTLVLKDLFHISNGRNGFNVMGNGDQTWNVKKSPTLKGSSPSRKKPWFIAFADFNGVKSYHQPTITKHRGGKRVCMHCTLSLLKWSLGFSWSLDKLQRPGTTENTGVQFCGRTHHRGECSVPLSTT